MVANTEQSAIAERFARLFSGYDRAYGIFRTSNISTVPGEKAKGRGVTMRGALTLEHYVRHLAGQTDQGLGVIPLRSDNTCSFAAIDIDDYTLDHVALAKQVAPLKLIVCRSKSGGAHCFAFFSPPKPAREVRMFLGNVAAFLNRGGSEIFPKQESRASLDDVGNWINLPYFGGDKSLRYAINPETGQAMTVAEFVEYAERLLIGAFPEIPIKESEELPEGPPCLHVLLSRGPFPEGMRNNGLFNVGVYLRKAHPDDWQDRLLAFNARYCQPPLRMGELQALIKSLNRKDYQYTCKNEPIRSVCNRRACLRRQYGIGESGEDSFLEIMSITKYPSDPVLWCVEVDGRRIETDTATLYSQSAFARLCMEKLNRCPPPMPAAKWRKRLDELLQNCDEVPPPPDADRNVQFVMFVEQWLYGRSQATDRDEMLLGKPWHHDGRIWFLSSALLQHMRAQGFNYGSPHAVWRALSTLMNARRERGITLKGGLYREPWSVPAINLESESAKNDEVPEEF